MESVRANQNRRLSSEATDDREAKLQRMKEYSAKTYYPSTRLPLFHQPAVKTRMLKFHSDIAAIDCTRCSTCLEQFPGLKLASNSTECARQAHP